MKPRLLLYCTKAKPYLTMTTDFVSFKKFDCYDRDFGCLNGKIVAVCDYEVEEIDFASQRFYENDIEKYNIEINKQNELLKRSCLTATQMVCYLDKKGKGQTNLKGYAIHIKNLHIFDEPRELSEYFTEAKKMNTIDGYSWVCESIDRAPQNMMYAYANEVNKYIVISIRPEWLCKILNGEKTIEVRKKILKEML